MKKLFTTKNIVLMAMFAAIAGLLMVLIEVPIPFIAPNFYELDFSEVPILIGSFVMGPIAGVVMEALKILIKIVVKGTTTGYVGDLANFCIGCCLVVPASIIYRLKKTKTHAFMGMIVGTIVMGLAGALLNYYVMLPFYENFMPIESIIKAGAAINPWIKDKWDFVWIAVAPFNIFKGVVVGIITSLIYKRISTLIKKI